VDVDPAVVAELSRRTDISWVRHGGGTRMVWHAWADGGLCVVSGGEEQPLLDLGEGDRVEVVLRSKDTRGRLLTWPGTVSVVPPQGPGWAPVTAALVAARLNLRDPPGAPDRWAHGSVVHRLGPAAG
jgi:hypothetical protein